MEKPQTEGRPEEKSAGETADATYKDDAADFAQSSGWAQGGKATSYDGDGPADAARDGPDPGSARGNNAGSQEDWRGPDRTKTPPEADHRD